MPKLGSRFEREREREIDVERICSLVKVLEEKKSMIL